MAGKTKNAAVAVTQENSVAVAPGTKIGRGMEKIDPSSITLPRVKLLQKMSPEIDDKDLGVAAGDFFNSTMLEKMEDTVFIPLSIIEDKTFMVPRDDTAKKEVKDICGLTDDDMDGLFICRAADNKQGDRFGNCINCGLAEFDNVNNRKPSCNKNVKVLAWFPQYSMPAILIFTSTSYKKGRAFRDLAYMYHMQGEDLFARMYKLTAGDEKNSKGAWYSMNVKPAGKATEEMYQHAEKLYNLFGGVALDTVVDEAPEQGPDTTTSEY